MYCIKYWLLTITFNDALLSDVHGGCKKIITTKSGRLAKNLDAGDEIIRHTEVKSLGIQKRGQR